MGGPRGLPGQDGHNGAKGAPGAHGPPGPPGDEEILPTRPGGEGAENKGPAYGYNYNYHYYNYQYYHAREEKKKERSQLNMFDLLEGLKIKVDGIAKPDGSPEFPAQSCKDIQMCFPEAETGEYWLDPNGGKTDDAIKVHCNFTGTVETCVEPTTEFDIFNMNEWKQDTPGHKWIAKHVEPESSEIMYQPRITQWKNLKVGMRFGRQNVTYHCKDSLAHRTVQGETKSFIKFLSNNNRELHTGASRSDRLNVVDDNCHMNDGSWRQAVL